MAAAHRHPALLVDACGHGESEGTGMDLGWWSERDAAAAVDFLVAQPAVPDRVGLLGLSMARRPSTRTA